MLVYFDTNIYRHISATGESAQVRLATKKAGWQIIASSDNLFETFAISDPIVRADELRILTQVATRFDKQPESFREAAEVREAMRRHRPDWIRPALSHGRTQVKLKDHVHRWREAKKGLSPPPLAYRAYRRIYEDGVAGATAIQRELRAKLLRREHAVILKRFGDRIAGLTTDLVGPDGFWRMAAFLAYDGAIVHQNMQTRDLADWLRPYLKPGKVNSEDLFVFWMQDVTPAEVPRAMWIGMITFAQLNVKVSHGNPADIQHAGYALDVDLFISADQGFCRALNDAKAHYPGRTARVVTWDRGKTSAVAALADILRKVS